MPFSNLWFWVFLCVLGWALAAIGWGSKAIGSRPGFGLFVLSLAEIPRFVLVLPFVDQPRISPVPTSLIALGAVVLVISLIFGSAALGIGAITRPDRSEPLHTGGLYSIVRHPVMFCDAFWPLGLSLMAGSIIGVALTPVWMLLAGLVTFPEEELLVEEYGDSYRDFQKRVPRLIPSVRRLFGSRQKP